MSVLSDVASALLVSLVTGELAWRFAREDLTCALCVPVEGQLIESFHTLTHAFFPL